MDANQLRRAAAGYRLSQAIAAFAELRIADTLAAGPLTAEQVAAATGDHEPYLHRLLRALAGEGVLARDDTGRYALTEASRMLASHQPLGDMIRGWSAFPPTYAAFGQLAAAVRSGRPPFELAHGCDFHAYLAAHPDMAQAYDDAMESTVESFEETVGHYDFSRFGSVVDVGGGGGGFLVALLRAHQHLRGICFDLPSVIDAARRRGIPEDVAGRLELCPGDFFHDPLPQADAYTLFTVLRLFEDEQAIALLSAIRRAMPDTAVIVVEDFWLPEGTLPPTLGLADLQALCVYGGRDRTRSEYEAVLAAADLCLGTVVDLGADSPYAIFEARRR